jgi:hypothetical protein
VPGELIVYKWEPPEGLPGILEVRIAREGGATAVRVIHSGFREGAEWDDEYEGVASGWKIALRILKFYLENHFVRGKTMTLVFRPAKLAQWLTVSGAIGNAGEKCELQLRDAGRLTGRVLAITDREVMLAWDEVGGVLELKTFPMGPQSVVGAPVMSWGLNSGEIAQLEKKMSAAVERLAALFPLGAAAGDASLPA